MLNFVKMIGKLTNTPIIKQVGNNYELVELIIEIAEFDTVNFIQVNAWNKAAKETALNLNIGDIVDIEGRINSKEMKSTRGKVYYNTSVTVNKISKIDYTHGASRPQTRPQTQTISEDDLPF